MCNANNSWCNEAVEAFFKGEFSTEIVPQADPFFTPIMIVTAGEYAVAMFCAN